MPQAGGIRLARPEDASAITGLIRSCYGGTYCVPAGADPKHVADAIAAGREIYALAWAGETLVAQAALVEHPHGWFECARVVVAESHRGGGLMHQLTRLLFEDAAPSRARLLTAGAVSSHAYGQRNAQALGMVPLGILLGQYPAWMRVAGFPARDEVTSSIVFARPTARLLRARGLGLLGDDLAFAREVLASLGLRAQDGPALPDSRLRWTLRSDATLGLAHLRLGGQGSADAPWTALALAPGRLQWVDVPAEHPAAGGWCARLRERGFGLAAYLPLAGEGGHDVLRLQRLAGAGAALDALRLLPSLLPLRARIAAEQAPDEVLA